MPPLLLLLIILTLILIPTLRASSPLRAFVVNPRHLYSFLFICGSFQAARADWQLQTSDFKLQDHLTINTWSPEPGLSATNQSGKLVNFPTRDLLSLSSGQPILSDPASRAWKLSLLNGDILYGDATAFSGKSLLFKTQDLGEIAIPIKRILTLSAPVYGPAAKSPRKIPPASDRDLLLFKETNDTLEGLITGIDLTDVQITPQGAAEPTTIPLEKIATLVFGGARPPREVPPLSVRLSFTSGNIYTVPLAGTAIPANTFNWSINTLTIKDAVGKDHVIDNIDRISRIDLLGGRVIFLTDLDFAKSEQTSFLGTSWPPQLNKNVLGQPLKSNRQTFDRGIGVHTQSTLTYQLDGTFDTLTLRVALDDSATPNGQALASITLDGKTLWQTNPQSPLTPGTITEELSLPIKNGKLLQLQATPASRLDIQGRLNWLTPALHRQ